MSKVVMTSEFAPQRLELPATLEQLPLFLDHIRQAAQLAGLAAARVMNLELAAEEALVNICNHAYAKSSAVGSALCQVTLTASAVRVELMDSGAAYNPLARLDPDTTLTLEQRQPGGLGILMVKQLSDAVSYRRELGQNVLVIEMRRSALAGTDRKD